MSYSTDSNVMEKVELREPVLWTVVLHNDDYTPMDFVIAVLVEVFHLSVEDAEVITMRVHHEGKSPVGQFTKEIANSKAKHVSYLAEQCEHPLLATAEPK